MLEILDTAGQEEYTALRDQWIRDGEGFVIVYGIGNQRSFARAPRFYNQITRTKGNNESPVMLVGHDYDEEEGRVKPGQRQVSYQEGRNLAKDLGCEFLEASAMHCINVEKTFYDLVRALRKQRALARDKQDGLPAISELSAQ